MARSFILVTAFIAGYRKQVVLENLKQAFPGLGEKEYRHLRFRYFLHLGDINAEFLKIPTMRLNTLRERVRFRNANFISELLQKHRHLVVVSSHMNNWEWGGLALSALFSDVRINGVYKPLTNDSFDAYFRDMRRRYGMHLVPMKSTLRAVLNSVRLKSITVLISDQSPTLGETEFVAPFFGTRVPVFQGAEKIARLTGYPVIYLAMKKLRRGYYEIEAIPITNEPKAEPMHQVTLRHLTLLETEIRREPTNWLWSHRRWKHAGKDFDSAVVMA